MARTEAKQAISALPHANGNDFVGRSRELAELEAGLSDVLRGSGRLFAVIGEPGIGKTRLASEIASQAAHRGARVVWGRGWEEGGAAAFWPWVQVLRTCMQRHQPPPSPGTDSAVSEIARLIPEVGAEFGRTRRGGRAGRRAALSSLSSDDPEAERFRLFDAVTNFLKNVARTAPLVIVLDDIHAADVDSLLFLRFLARDAHDAPLMLIVTYRESEVRLADRMPRLIGDINREGQLITLRGISEAETTKFVEGIVGRGIDPVVVTELYRVTEGNPFFLGQVVRLLLAETSTQEPRALVPASIRIPEEVRVTIRRRLELVSESARSVLSLASVLGREFEVAEIGRISELPFERLAEALEEACRAGLLTEMPEATGRYRFNHALVAETSYGDLAKPYRQQLHARIARTLEHLYRADLDEHLAEIAFHLVRALPAGDPAKAVDYAWRAAERATQLLAHEEAARRYRIALEALALQNSPDQSLRCELLLARGDALYRARLFQDSRLTFEQALELARRLKGPELLARAVLGIGLLPSDPGTVNQALLALLEEALNAMGDQDNALRAMLFSRLSWELYYQSGAEERRAMLSQKAVAIARRLGQDETLIYVLHNWHLATWGPDNLHERLAVANEIIRLCEKSANHLYAPRARYLRLADLLELGEVQAVDDELENFSKLKEHAWLALADKERAQATRALIDGSFEEAQQLAETARTLGERLGHRATMNFRLQRFALGRELGAFEGFEPLLTAALTNSGPLALNRCLLALVFAETGRPDEAKSQFEVLARDDFAAFPRNAAWLAEMVMLAQVCAFVGDAPSAAILYKLLHPYSSRNATIVLTVCLGSVAHYLAMLAATMSHFAQAQAHFEEALKLNHLMGAKPFVARTQLEYAAMLLAQGRPNDRERALDLLHQALDTATALGMKAIEERAKKLFGKLSSSGKDGLDRRAGTVDAERGVENLFRKEGHFWTIAYQGRVVRIKDLKGIGYIARLLQHPGSEFHVLALEAGVDAAGLDGRSVEGVTRLVVRTEQEIAELGLRTGGLDDAGAMLDSEAKTAYKRRLVELREELDEAKEFGHVQQSSRIEEEIESLVKELSRAVGLGGRDRRAASQSERARINVVRAIKSATEKIAAHHSELGCMLSKAVRTGTFCRYLPDSRNPTSWAF
jgi:hypothetical protein